MELTRRAPLWIGHCWNSRGSGRLGTQHYDVVQMGLGVMGLATVEASSRRRLKTLGLEQFESPFHPYGSSHGPTRMIRQAYYEDPRYVPLVLSAYRAWRDLEKWAGQTLLVQGGGLVVGASSSPVVRGALHSASEHGLAVDVLALNEFGPRYGLGGNGDTVALFEPGAGVIKAARALTTLHQKAIQQGAEFQFGTKIAGISGEAGSFRLDTTTGEVIVAEHLIMTPGPWISEWLKLPVRIERQPVYWFETDDPPEIPVFLYDRGQVLLYGFPYVPGQGLKIGVHHTEHYTTPMAVDREVGLEEIAEMVRHMAEIFPGHQWRLREAEVCLYTTTPDGHFIVGRTGAGLVVGGGFSGHGFKFAPIIGEMLLDSALSGTNPKDYELFWPSRFGPPHGQ